MIDSKTRAAYFFTLPTLLFFVIIFYIPIGFAAIMSFHRWSVLGSAKFLGWRNYEEIFTRSPIFLIALKNTFLFTFGYVVLIVISSLFVAAFINKLGRLGIPLKTACFLPVISSMVGISIVWKWIYQPHFGLANQLLGYIGLGPFSWLMSPATAMISVIIASAWKRMGLYVIILLAGLQNIPEAQYEAAKIDGASKFQLFRHITLPLLWPVILFVIVIVTIRGLRAFTQIFIMTRGGPGNATRVAAIAIYHTAFRTFQMGKGSAMAFILFILIFVLSYFQIRFFSSTTD